MNKYQYQFEIEESINDNVGVFEVDSLETALRRMRQDGMIYATCHYPVHDGRTCRQVVRLIYEDIEQKSEKEIYEHLDYQVDSFRFQNKSEEK